MDFIFVQAPTLKKYTGEKGYEDRSESPQEDHVEPIKEDIVNSKIFKGYLPQGGLFIAEELLRSGITVAIVHGKYQSIVREIDRLVTNYTVAIGISTLAGNMLEQAIQIARYIRQNHPDKPIIWGGVHPTAIKEQTIQHPLVDYVVWGEGELVLPQLLEAIRAKKGFEKIKGIGYKVGNRTFLTGMADYTPLDRVFDLPFHLLDIDCYTRKMLIGGDRWLPVMTSRGCPFGCKFCNNSSLSYPNSKVRYHTIDHILATISRLVDEYAIDAIGFEDELTAVNDKRIIELCHALRSLNKKLTYRLSSRVDIINRLSDDALRLMRETGFVSVGYGIESGSQRILDFMGKKITIQQVLDADKRLTDFGFFKSFNFMIGLPTETLEEMKMSILLLVKLLRNSKYCPYPCSNIPPYTPLPDTELFFIAQKHGFRSPEKMEGWIGLDGRHVANTLEHMRPWLTLELDDFARKADKMAAEVSTYFTGKDADEARIDSLLDDFERFASSG